MDLEVSASSGSEVDGWMERSYPVPLLNHGVQNLIQFFVCLDSSIVPGFASVARPVVYFPDGGSVPVMLMHLGALWPIGISPAFCEQASNENDDRAVQWKTRVPRDSLSALHDHISPLPKPL